MPKSPLDSHDRLEQQYRRLGTREPVCVCCGETNPFCLELHHIAGRKYHDDVVIICRNCHRKLTDQQQDDAPPSTPDAADPLTAIACYLLGVAALFLLLVKALRQFAKQLMEHRSGPVSG